MFKKRSKLSSDSDDSKRRKLIITENESHDNDDGDVVVRAPIFKKRSKLSNQNVSLSHTSDNIHGYDHTRTDNRDSNSSKHSLSENKQNDITGSDRLNSEQQLDSAQIADKTKKKKTASDKIVQAANLKTTIFTDYQPDICKDYQQTGYCGYGDSCKFLHSRDDFKAGWKLNTDWKVDEESSEKRNANVIEENIPFKCVICKKDYKNPVKTNCGHYFCSSCFTKRIDEDRSCFICGSDTKGVAKIAKDLKKQLAKSDSSPTS